MKVMTEYKAMKSIKAIIAGSLFIIIVSLLMQLAFILVAVGYNALAEDYPFLNDITVYFKYLLGIPILMLIMFSGGYITATIAHTRVLLHCLVVSVITIGLIMFSALQNANITVTGIVVIILITVTTLAGGLYWQRQQ